MMGRVGATILVGDEPVCADGVLIGASFSLHQRDGRDADRYSWQDRRLKDALGSDERNALTLELEPVLQNLSRQLVAIELNLVVEEFEGLTSHLGVKFLRIHLRSPHGVLAF